METKKNIIFFIVDIVLVLIFVTHMHVNHLKATKWQDEHARWAKNTKKKLKSDFFRYVKLWRFSWMEPNQLSDLDHIEDETIIFFSSRTILDSVGILLSHFGFNEWKSYFEEKNERKRRRRGREKEWKHKTIDRLVMHLKWTLRLIFKWCDFA